MNNRLIKKIRSNAGQIWRELFELERERDTIVRALVLLAIAENFVRYKSCR